MNKLLIVLLLGTTLSYSKSTIVNGELVLADECISVVDDAKRIFRQHSGDPYSIIAKAEFALRRLDFASCDNFRDSDYRDEAIATIEMSLAYAERKIREMERN